MDPAKLSQVNLTLQQEEQLDAMFKLNALKQYFHSADNRLDEQSKRMAEAFLCGAEMKLSVQLRQGNVQIAQQRTNVNAQVAKQKQKRQQVKLSKQQERLLALRQQRQVKNQLLQYLDMQIGSRPDTINPEIKISNVLSKQQHDQLVLKIRKERSQRDRQHRVHLKSMQQSLLLQQKRKKEGSEYQREQSLTERKQKIQYGLAKRRQMHEKMLSDQKQANRKYQDAKNKKTLHEELQQRFHKEVLAKNLEQKKQRLKEIRDISRAFNVSDINHHQKQYLTNRQNLLQNSRKKPPGWNYVPPQKTKKLSTILENQKLQLKRQSQEKKRSIEERLDRKKAYLEQLMVKHRPTIDEEKRIQIELRTKENGKRKRSSVDPRVAGLSYLEYSKQRKKISDGTRPQTQKTMENMSERQVRTNKAHTNYLDEKKTKQQYENMRRKKIQSMAHSVAAKRQDKIMSLERQNQKIDQELRRKQKVVKHSKYDANNSDAVELLLTSIKAKMELIEVIKKD